MASLVIDIETENTGADLIADSKRIISVQIGNSTNQELYYADARNPSLSTSQEEPKGQNLTWLSSRTAVQVKESRWSLLDRPCLDLIMSNDGKIVGE